MYYYDDTLEEMSEDHKSAILQKNKSPPDDGHKVMLKEFNVEKENENGIQKRCDK